MTKTGGAHLRPYPLNGLTMKTTEFLNAILSDEGEYCVVGIKKAIPPIKNQ